MIETSFTEVHTKDWINQHLSDVTHELFVVRQVIPWQRMIDQLIKYYKEDGRLGINLRTMVAVLILQKLRLLGDQEVIDLVKENRYAQYFCNVGDRERHHFLNRSTLVRFRQRLGVKGCQQIERLSFENLRRSGAVENDAALIDSSVLANNVIYPNDVDLLYKAFGKLESWAEAQEIAPWWNVAWVKQRWREFNLGKKQERLKFLLEFQTVFTKASKQFQQEVRQLQDSTQKKQESIGWRCSNS